MLITSETLAAIAVRPINDNMQSMVLGLQMAGVGAGLNRPHRLAHFLAQTAHESMGWHYDREVWGPTAAQARYEGRRDLGNVQQGDGYRFRGRSGGQITGRTNYAAFTAWARRMDASAPDFTANPDAVNTDPWEGLGPIWYWDDGNPTGESLNAYADANNAEMITRRINGGLNGYADRLHRYTRAALVLLGYPPDAVLLFQGAARFTGKDLDGLSGPKTRAALHAALTAAPLVRFTEDQPPALPPVATSDEVLAAIYGILKPYMERT